MTKILIGFLAIVLGVAGSTLIASPKKNQMAGATGGYVYVKNAGPGYRQINTSDYNGYNCNTTEYGGSVCGYYVTEYGAGIVTAATYTDAEVAEFASGYSAKLRAIQTVAMEPYRGTYEEFIFE
ncbi:hypothetical protein [Filimonas effusa]|uniref:Uncharacterized protein n=1 Tax=Filimonas effusa TaxID=2508721 RepID=A0A4Q1D545_9BACT|nr:hypothetical protein [Filimonas effusa]RXK83076.1 hypothetical protein ESB13_13205 [Filimonas effusa]